MGLRVSSPVLVGRVEELAVLHAILDQVAAGRSATVLIGGEAGIGKTRLVRELCGHAEAAGALVATGVCAPPDGGPVAYGPVVGQLRDVARRTGQDETPAILATLSTGTAGEPVATDSGSPVSSRSLADDLARTRLVDAVLRLVGSLSEHDPLVLVFEDLHWADSATAQLLAFLSRNLATERVLLVGTYRNDELGRGHRLRPWLSELTRLGHVTHLLLDGLERPELAALITGIVGAEPNWALVEAVWARSQGNPFLAEELTAARDDATLSPELRDVVLARTERLSAQARQLLRLAAVAGAVVDHDLLTAAGDAAEIPDLDAALADAVGHNVLVVDQDRLAYRFRHVLVREAVMATLLPGERQRLHRRVAEALDANAGLLAAQPGHRAGELATHWWEAKDWARALTWSLAAADAATKLRAFPEALAHLKRAVACQQHLTDGASPSAEPVGPGRVDLLERAAQAAALAMDHDAAMDYARQAIASLGADDDPFLLAACYAQLGTSAWENGLTSEAFDAYDRAAAVVPVDPPTPALVRILAGRANLLMLTFRDADAEKLCREALVLARRIGARWLEGRLLSTLGACRGSLGHIDEGIALVKEALVIAEEQRDPNDLYRAYTNLSHLLLEWGRLEEATAVAPGYDGALTDRWGLVLGGAVSNSSEALLRLGRYEESDQVMAGMIQQGLGACRPTPSIRRTQLALRKGLLDEAQSELAEVRRLTSNLEDVQFRGAYHLLRAELAILQRRPAEALGHVNEVLAVADGTEDMSLRPEVLMVGVRALADQQDDARLHGRPVDSEELAGTADALLDEFRRLLARTSADGGRCSPRVEALIATACAERARLDQPEPDRWREAARLWERAGEPYHVAHCRWREAGLLLDGRVERARATTALQQAWRITAALGAGALREPIEQLAQRARVPLALTEGADGDEAATALVTRFRLTRRELEVLAHLSTGLTDREIADSLIISKKTASVHVSNLLRKLAVPNRIEAGRIAQAHGLHL